ncbi:MAG: hypothetical protein WBD06_08605 [Acidobacteriaceae bacterium]
MVDSIFGKHGGVGEAQFVAVEKVFRHFTKGTNSLVAGISEVVESLL